MVMLCSLSCKIRTLDTRLWFIFFYRILSLDTCWMDGGVVKVDSLNFILLVAKSPEHAN
jgi:hypothetical protein